MTEEDAFALYDFMMHRFGGWDIALGIADRDRLDCRTKQAKDAMVLMRDIILSEPPFDQMLAALKADKDPVSLWPERLQDVVRFRLWHRVPREINEPLSEGRRQTRQDEQGMPPWPDFLNQYSKPATWRDHPPIPQPSERVTEIERRRAARKGKSA